jgi:hypothetical protein
MNLKWNEAMTTADFFGNQGQGESVDALDALERRVNVEHGLDRFKNFLFTRQSVFNQSFGEKRFTAVAPLLQLARRRRQPRLDGLEQPFIFEAVVNRHAFS